jgi:hypothetical protein
MSMMKSTASLQTDHKTNSVILSAGSQKTLGVILSAGAAEFAAAESKDP